MGAPKTYSPENVKVTVGGAPISGFADGTFIKVSRASDAFTKVTGADGSVTRVKSADKSGEITITLMQSSQSNAILQAIALVDETSGKGVVPIAILELNTGNAFVTGSAWIKKVPDAEFGKETTNREWVFDCSELNVFNAGNNV